MRQNQVYCQARNLILGDRSTNAMWFKVYCLLQDLVFLSVGDCRSNIEAVHYLTTDPGISGSLQALRLYATDPLLSYKVLQLTWHT